MASIVRWDPFRDLLSLQHDVDRLFSDVGFRPTAMLAQRTPARVTPMMDVFARGEDLVLRAELPGINTEDVDISVTDDVLTLRAERHEDKEIQEDDYLVRESSWGTFERSTRLPAAAKVDKIHATYADGVLEIVVPKGAPSEGRTHHVPIKASTRKAKELPTEHH